MKNFKKFTPLLQIANQHSLYSAQSNKIKKSIYVCKSTNIFTNLAIEDWFYKNFDFSNHHILMMWKNQPCVVIGRHQNPWIECNFSELPNITEHGVQLARRNSGGGTVFHDLGNLNLTFFTSREFYNRKQNLELISKALNQAFDLDIEISPREDLVIGNKKISGTASKLGRTTAYHHCTLLINANKERLSRALRSDIGEVKTSATRSVKSPIINIGEINEDVCIHKAMDVISNEYAPIAERIYVDGEEILFPGISEIKDQYQSYAWRFGKTPKFKVFRTIQGKSNDLHLEIFLEVEKGEVVKVDLENKERRSANDFGSDFENLFSGLIGKKFGKETLNEFEMLVEGLRQSKVMCC